MAGASAAAKASPASATRAADFLFLLVRHRGDQTDRFFQLVTGGIVVELDIVDQIIAIHFERTNLETEIVAQQIERAARDIVILDFGDRRENLADHHRLGPFDVARNEHDLGPLVFGKSESHLEIAIAVDVVFLAQRIKLALHRIVFGLGHGRRQRGGHGQPCKC